MDLALRYSADIDGLDISLSGTDLRGEDTLATAVALSLQLDRTAEAHEVGAGEDRRGWWADTYAEVVGDQHGSRLWLLGREKQLPATVQRAVRYVREALQWIVSDGLALSIDVAGFIPRAGWLMVDAVFQLAGESRRYRFAWNESAHMWTLSGEGFEGASNAV